MIRKILEAIDEKVGKGGGKKPTPKKKPAAKKKAKKVKSLVAKAVPTEKKPFVFKPSPGMSNADKDVLSDLVRDSDLQGDWTGGEWHLWYDEKKAKLTPDEVNAELGRLKQMNRSGLAGDVEPEGMSDEERAWLDQLKQGQPEEPIQIGTMGAYTPTELSRLGAMAATLGGQSPAGAGVLVPKGRDGSHGGLTDLYPEWKRTLEVAWKRGDFSAKWGSKKEIVWATLTKQGDNVTVEVEVQTDNPYENTMAGFGIGDWDDALWEAFGKLLPEEQKEKISAAMAEDDELDHVIDAIRMDDDSYDSWAGESEFGATVSDTVPATTLDDAVEKASELWDEANKQAHDKWQSATNTKVELALDFIKRDPKQWGFKNEKAVDTLHKKHRAEVEKRRKERGY